MSGIVRVQHDKERPYVTISKTLSNDKRLSFRLRGMLVYLLGKPPTWQARMTEIAGAGTEKEDAVRAMFAEGRKFGYITTTARRGQSGRWEYEHVIYESPINPPIPDILNADGTVHRLKQKGTVPESPHPDDRTRVSGCGSPGTETRVLVSNEGVTNELASGQAGETPPKTQQGRADDSDALQFFDGLCGYGFVAQNRLHLARWFEAYTPEWLRLAWQIAPTMKDVRVARVGFIWLLNREKPWPDALTRQYARDQKPTGDGEGEHPQVGELRATQDGRTGRVIEVDAGERKLTLQIGDDASDCLWLPWASTRRAG